LPISTAFCRSVGIGKDLRTTRSSRRNKMESPKTRQTPVAAPRQLCMALDSVKLRDLSPSEREEIVLRLARLLLEAAGIPMRERDDERR
jgi:hypothetical protein